MDPSKEVRNKKGVRKFYVDFRRKETGWEKGIMEKISKSVFKKCRMRFRTGFSLSQNRNQCMILTNTVTFNKGNFLTT
jgi:hypothetical protein